MTEDAKFAGIQTGGCGWYWNKQRTNIARVTRDGSGTLWAFWGDGRGSDQLPDGPEAQACPNGTCHDAVQLCAQRGIALDVIRDELQAAMSILLRVQVDNPAVDKELLRRVLAAHGIAMATL